MQFTVIFRKRFVYVNTPIITGSDAEGAGEMFKVTARRNAKNRRRKSKLRKISLERNNLTVSGQLEGETLRWLWVRFILTFRAENSNTSRHLAEFWMIEPEVAFNDLNDNMDLAEDLFSM
jgi:asparaginyl-tRNA synthetase